MLDLMLRERRINIYMLQIRFCTTFSANCAEITVRESITEYLLAMDMCWILQGDKSLFNCSV
jgi:hypothetical protein